MKCSLNVKFCICAILSYVKVYTHNRKSPIVNISMISRVSMDLYNRRPPTEGRL